MRLKAMILSAILAVQSCFSLGLTEVDVTRKIQQETLDQRIEIIVVGDLLLHDSLYAYFPQEEWQEQMEKMFAPVKPYFDEADLVIGNFEGVYNPDLPLSSYPTFNYPAEYLYALKNVGFDALGLANNHCLDGGLDGSFSTKAMIEELGMIPFGFDDGENLPVAYVRDKVIGLFALTEYFNGLDQLLDDWTLNEKYHLFDTYSLSGSLDRLMEESDYTMVFPHWGVEYTPVLSGTQEYFSEFFWEKGIQAVIGSHPHMVQQMHWDEDEDFFILYSLGNFVADQRRGNYDQPRFVESGVMMKLILKQNEEGLYLHDVRPIPLWRQIYYDDQGYRCMRILPLDNEDILANLNQEDYSYALEAKQDVEMILQGLNP